MPYINLDRRIELWSSEIGGLASEDLSTGDVTYIVCSLLWNQFDNGPSFVRAAELIGAINCAVMEFYRRKVAPYEDTKIAENGDL